MNLTIHWLLLAFNCCLHAIKWRTDAYTTSQFTIRLCHVVTERISVRVQLLSAFEKFDIAHDLVQALCNDAAEKWVRMLRFSSHLSVQAYDSSSANISWRGFFRRDNRFFSPGGLPTDKIRWQEALMRSRVRRTSQPCYGCWTSVTKFTPITTILYFLEWDMWWMRFKSNFPENDNLDFFLVWAYPCEMKTSEGNLKNAATLPW